MLEITERLNSGTPSLTLTLAFESRQRSRLRAFSDEGPELLLNLPRGKVLRDGDLVGALTGEVVVVRAAPERLSRVALEDALALARVAYHLGNRHIALQLEARALCYLEDPVLDDMVRQLGAKPHHVEQPFEPEGGAYGRSAEGGHHHHV